MRRIWICVLAFILAAGLCACTAVPSGAQQESSAAGIEQDTKIDASESEPAQQTDQTAAETAVPEPVSAETPSAEPQTSLSPVPDDEDGPVREVLDDLQIDLLEEKSTQDFPFEKVNEIITGAYGASYVIWTKKDVTNLMLIAVSYDGDQFTESTIYCSYDVFTTDDCILFTHDYPDGFPNVKLEFDDASGTHRSFFVTMSGYDGRPVLVTEESVLF